MYHFFFPNSHDLSDEMLFYTFTRYLETAMRNTRIRYMNKQNELQKQEEPTDFMTDTRTKNLEDSSVKEEMERLLLWDLIRSHLDCLTTTEYSVLSCIYFDALSGAETSRKLGLSASTVSYHHRHALEKLHCNITKENHNG